MSVWPTNKTVPLDKDIGVADALTQSINTSAREQLSVVLAALDQAIATSSSNATAAIAAEATARSNEDLTFVKLNGSRAMTGNLDMANNRIIQVATPTTGTDAANRNYVDGAVSTEAGLRSAADTILQNEIDGERSPLRVTVSGSNTTINIAAATQNRISSTGATVGPLGVPSGVFQSGFPGAAVDFAAGTIVYTGGSPASDVFTLATYAGQANQWTKYSVVLLPTDPDTLLISWGGAFGASAAAVASPVVTGGVPIAIVSVQVNGAANGIQNIVSANVTQFVAAGAGGSGAGAGSPLDPQDDENFTYYTRSDFAVDAKKFFGSTTGTDSVLGLKKIVLGVGQVFNSLDLTGPQFRADAALITQAQVRLMYNTGKVDESALIQLSLDGGATYSTGTNFFPGSSTAAAYVSNFIASDFYFAQSATAAFDGGTANGSLTTATKVAAVIQPTYRLIANGFAPFIRTSSTTGSVKAYIYAVASGLPTTLLATSNETFAAGQEITSSGQYVRFTFPNVSLESGTQYALAVEGTGLSSGLSIDQVTSAPSFSVSSASGAVSYVASGTKLAYRLFGMGGDVRLKVTSATAASELTGFGVNFVPVGPLGIRGDASYEVRTLTSTEATTGLISLNSVRYTPGARQLMVFASNHIFTGPNDFTEINTSQVQFAANAFAAGDVLTFYNAYGLVDGSSVSLSKINSIWDCVVGTSVQVSAGIATHSTIAAAITAAPSQGRILILRGTYAENVMLTKELAIEGQGRGTVLNGFLTLSTGSDYSCIEKMKVTGPIALTSSGSFVHKIWVPTISITDSGTGNSKLLIQE